MREKLEGRAYAEAFVHALTHEMKSPLAAIRGAAELMEDPAMPEADRRRFLAHVQASELRLRQLIERMLDLATLQHRQALKDPVPLDLAVLASRVLEAKAVLAERAAVRLEAEVPAATFVKGEALLLEQALSNLLDNALAFSPEGAAVQLAVESTPTSHVLVVRDAGPGLPDFALARAFEAFYALPRPGSEARGTGLGLAFVREIAALHGGRASLANRPGGGAEAWLELPKA
jgi:two-component system sensor histidine kinase CreC